MININHPDLPKYQAEREKALSEFEEEMKAIEDAMKAENYQGKDGPNVRVYKKFAHKLKKLQQKYYYLFENDD